MKESSSSIGPASNKLEKPNFRAMLHCSLSAEDGSIPTKLLSSVTQWDLEYSLKNLEEFCDECNKNSAGLWRHVIVKKIKQTSEFTWTPEYVTLLVGGSCLDQSLNKAEQ